MARSSLFSIGTVLCLTLTTIGVAITESGFCGEPGGAQARLSLGRGEATVAGQAELALTLSASVPIQAVQAIFEWDGAAGTGTDLVAAPAVADADALEIHVADDHMVLGVVVDTDGEGENSIPAGEDTLLATASIRCDTPGEAAVGFVDGKYAASDGGPLLDNLVVIDGLAVGTTEGLVLEGGSFTCREEGVPVRRLALGSDEAVSGDHVELPLTLSSSDPVQGLVAVFEWESAAGTGVDLVAAPSVAGADSLELRAAADFMILGVVMDTDGTGDSAIPAANDVLLATAIIRCDSLGEADVRFVDGAHALADEGPVLDNLVVIEGLSIGVEDGLELSDGSFVCRAGGDTVTVAFDVKPGSCPNPVNVRSQGVTPVAILGADGFDVTQIDPESLRLEGIEPLRWSLEDVSTPFEGEAEEGDCRSCTESGLDGIVDLTVKFDTPELVAALGEVSDEECRVVRITGNLLEDAGGNDIQGTDVIRILVKGNGRGRHGGGDDDRPPPPRRPSISSRALAPDVTGDGIVDLRDPLALLGHLAGRRELAVPAEDADANGDGGVDLDDVLLLLSELLVVR